MENGKHTCQIPPGPHPCPRPHPSQMFSEERQPYSGTKNTTPEFRVFSTSTPDFPPRFFSETQGSKTLKFFSFHQ